MNKNDEVDKNFKHIMMQLYIILWWDELRAKMP